MSGYVPRRPRNEAWVTSNSTVLRLLSNPRSLSRDICTGLQFNMTGRAGVKISHTNMSGGAYLVEDDYVGLFNRYLVADLRQMNVLGALTEIHTPLFPMFFDVDLMLERATPIDDFVRCLAGIIQTVIATFYPHGPVVVAPESESTPAPSVPSTDWFRVVVCTKHENDFSTGETRRHVCPPAPFKRPPVTWVEVTDTSQSDRSGAVEAPDVLAEALLRAALQASDSACPGVTEGTVLHLAPADAKTSEGLGLVAGDVVKVHVSWTRTNPEQGEDRFFRPVGGKWKHGLHIHVPEVVVNVEQAARIRSSVLDQLDLHGRRVAHYLKTDSGNEVYNLKWSEIIDEGVYRHTLRGGGLRLIGAPKTERCRARHPMGAVCPCMSNGGKLIDPCYYWPEHVYRGKQVVYENDLPVDVARPEAFLRDESDAALREMVRMTTVRCAVDVEATPGWRMDPSSMLSRRSMWNAGATDRKKLPLAFEPSAQEVQLAKTKVATGGEKASTFLTDEAYINDPRKLREIRGILESISPRYAAVALRARGTSDHIIVCLQGRGCNFCPGKGREHSRSTVFMYISTKDRARTAFGGPVRRSFVAVLKCHSTKCKDFHRLHHLRPEVADVLFPHDNRQKRGATQEAGRELAKVLKANHREGCSSGTTDPTLPLSGSFFEEGEDVLVVAGGAGDVAGTTTRGTVSAVSGDGEGRPEFEVRLSGGSTIFVPLSRLRRVPASDGTLAAFVDTSGGV